MAPPRNKAHKCPYDGCDKEYSNLGDLQDHKYSAAHENRRMRCPHCNKEFPHSKNTRKRHIPQCERTSRKDATEARTQPHQKECPRCGISQRSDNLKRHMKICQGHVKRRASEQKRSQFQSDLTIYSPIEELANPQESSPVTSSHSTGNSSTEFLPNVLSDSFETELFQPLPDYHLTNSSTELQMVTAPQIHPVAGYEPAESSSNESFTSMLDGTDNWYELMGWNGGQ